MTNQEAIDLIQHQFTVDMSPDEFATRWKEACRKAVEALKVVEALEALEAFNIETYPALWGFSDRPKVSAWRYDKGTIVAEGDTLSAAILEARAKL